MKKLIYALTGAISLFAAEAQSEIPFKNENIKEEMNNNLISIQNTFHSVYAPAEWKKQHLGWTIDDAVNKAMKEVNATPNITIKEYQQILTRMFSSSKDYHASIYFYSTEAAMLPFRVRGADGRYFVAWIDPKFAMQLPFRVGDEITAFDGKPVQEMISDYLRDNCQGHINETDREFASIFLTLRVGTMGHSVPYGSVTISFKNKGKDAISTTTKYWLYQKEMIKGLQENPSEAMTIADYGVPEDIYQGLRRFGMHNTMAIAMNKAIDKALKVKSDGLFPLGDRHGPLPLLGQPYWCTNDSQYFFAYTFPTKEGKTLGYIRIPQFIGETDEKGTQIDVLEFRNLIAAFQNETDGLVIDLLDNSGGYMHLLLTYLSFLSDKPIPFLKQRVMITQESIFQSYSYIEEIDTYLNEELQPSERTFLLQIRDYFCYLIDEWNAGRTLTNPVYLYGMDKTQPDPEVGYTKPILVLTNGLDFSCADLFPAVLQDAGRATIFGSRTAGAGGAVMAHDYPNKLGIAAYSYTVTIAERSDEKPIENLGVIPDVKYRINADDLQNGYKGYREAVLEAMKSLIE